MHGIVKCSVYTKVFNVELYMLTCVHMDIWLLFVTKPCMFSSVYIDTCATYTQQAIFDVWQKPQGSGIGGEHWTVGEKTGGGQTKAVLSHCRLLMQFGELVFSIFVSSLIQNLSLTFQAMDALHIHKQQICSVKFFILNICISSRQMQVQLSRVQGKW